MKRCAILVYFIEKKNIALVLKVDKRYGYLIPVLECESDL